jgi:hypothetical protein
MLLDTVLNACFLRSGSDLMRIRTILFEIVRYFNIVALILKTLRIFEKRFNGVDIRTLITLVNLPMVASGFSFLLGNATQERASLIR